MERVWPLRFEVSLGCARAHKVSHCCVYLRFGGVGVQVDALEVEDVVLGVIAVVERVVSWD